jgi:hypothetical protein
MITLRVEDVQPSPGLLYFLGNVQWLDAFPERFERAVIRLADVIHQQQAYPASPTNTHRALQARNAGLSGWTPNPRGLPEFWRGRSQAACCWR